MVLSLVVRAVLQLLYLNELEVDQQVISTYYLETIIPFTYFVYSSCRKHADIQEPEQIGKQ